MWYWKDEDTLNGFQRWVIVGNLMKTILCMHVSTLL